MKFSVPVVRDVELQATPGKHAFKIFQRISKIQRYKTIWGKKPALPGVAVAARSRLNQEDGVNIAILPGAARRRSRRAWACCRSEQ